MAPTIVAEMRAGLLEMKGGRLNADTRRGLLQVVKVCYSAHIRWLRPRPYPLFLAKLQCSDDTVASPSYAVVMSCPWYCCGALQ